MQSLRASLAGLASGEALCQSLEKIKTPSNASDLEKIASLVAATVDDARKERDSKGEQTLRRLYE